MGPTRRLLFVADVGGEQTYHVGDEGMLEANLATLRRLQPGLHATVVSPHPWPANGTAENLPGLGFPPLGQATASERLSLLQQFLAAAEGGEGEARAAQGGRVGDLVCAMRQADGLVVSGGGNLNSRWPEHLYERVALSQAAYRLGKPVAFVGQTLGPELSAAERQLLAPALRQASWVGVRDLSSVSVALSLGVTPARLDYQLDDAFLLEPRPPSAEESRQLPSLDGDWIAVTLHPFAQTSGELVLGIAGQLTRVAAATGARLVFLPHQGGESPGSDMAFCGAVAAMLAPQVEAWVCPVFPARLVRWVTGRASMVLSSRYHPLVFGLSAAVPCLAIYADEYCRVKARGALMHAGQSRSWSLRLDEAGGGALAERALDLWSQRQQLHDDLASLQLHWRDREARRWPRLLAALGLEAGGTAAATAATGDSLLGDDPRSLALALATALEERDCAARAEVERMAAETDRLRAELRWVIGTVAWRVRTRLLRLHPLVAAYRAFRGLRRESKSAPGPQPAAASANR